MRVFSGGASGPGRVLWQPDSHLVTFKNTFVPWVSVGCGSPSQHGLSCALQEDTVDCWTEDGLETNLTVAVQTRYIPEELFDIVFEFGEEDSFVPFVTEIVSELLRDECSKFTAFNYYDSRGIIQTNMTNRIETDLPRLSTHIRSGGFLQLKNIKLPDEFNVAITNKRIAEQDIQVRQNQRAQQIIVANTHFSQAINNGLIQINTAKQNAQALLFAAQQQALGIQAAYAQRVLVYTLGAQQLNLTADE